MRQVGVQTNPGAGVGGQVGASSIIPPVPPVPPSNPNAIVAGAGTVEANGEYPPQQALHNGKKQYNLSGTDPESLAISWTGFEWVVWGALDALYSSPDDVEFPWLTTFVTVDGTPPAPTVSHS